MLSSNTVPSYNEVDLQEYLLPILSGEDVDMNMPDDSNYSTQNVQEADVSLGIFVESKKFSSWIQYISHG